jgi:uncharacterized protein (TIGR03067 family)
MHRFLPLIFVPTLGFAPVPFPKPNPNKDDLKKMQGKWLWIYTVEDGRRENQTKEMFWLIEGNRVSTTEDGKAFPLFFIALDARATPRAIDVRQPENAAPHLFGRYSVDGDTLKVCFGKEKRPGGLAGDGASFGVWVFKRKRN